MLLIFFVLVGIGDSKKKKDALDAEQKRRKDAEDYIMNSGDAEAIKAMMLARANPAAQGQFANGGATGGNSFVKTAAAVATGVVVGEVVVGAVAASALSSALEEVAKSGDFSAVV